MLGKDGSLQVQRLMEVGEWNGRSCLLSQDRVKAIVLKGWLSDAVICLQNTPMRSVSFQSFGLTVYG